MHKSTFRIFSLALLTLAFGLLQAQAKSDFSGTWKANAGKSDFGPMPPPDSMTQKIVHADPSLKVNVAQTGGGGDLTYDMVYTTDGKECLNHMGGDNEIKTKLTWDGNDLVGDSVGSYEGNDFTASFAVEPKLDVSADPRLQDRDRHPRGKIFARRQQCKDFLAACSNTNRTFAVERLGRHSFPFRVRFSALALSCSSARSQNVSR